MEIKSAEFVTSIGNKKALKDFGKPEFAFVGRSNSGKSSLINALTKKRKLAKTSSLPGRTRLINYFLINNEFYFVDLPGYGYAQASKTAQNEWKQLIETYLESANNIRCVFVLLDIRHLPSELDMMMLHYLYAKCIPFKILLTKADKLSKMQIKNQTKLIANAVKVGEADVVATSSENAFGIDKTLELFDFFLEMEGEQ